MIYEPPPDVNSDMQKQGRQSAPEQLSGWAQSRLYVLYTCVCVSLSSSAGQGG